MLNKTFIALHRRSLKLLSGKGIKWGCGQQESRLKLFYFLPDSEAFFSRFWDFLKNQINKNTFH